jgi:hypothetical protein
VTIRWHFLGHPLPPGFPDKWPPNVPVREIEDDGVHIYRERTEDVVPVPRHYCTCSHGASTHTGGYGQCWLSMCACERFTEPQEKTA